MNQWKEIWEKRTEHSELLESTDSKKVFLELKRCNGFDVVGEGMTYEALYNQYVQTKNELSFSSQNLAMDYIKSVYEIGCGSGANLYLFEKDGIQCGGIDYSDSLIRIAKKVLKTNDLICDEAINISSDKKYDAILSNSVFSYFPNKEYAYSVLEKMYEKATRSIGILDIHDEKKELDFIEYRKKTIEDYEERYKNLPKLFYPKKFFIDFAKQHNLDIKFVNSNMEGYWNNDFIFHCYMYKREI